MDLVGRTLRRMLACWHLVLGCAWFRLGRHVRARRHFERVLLVRGDCFAAYVQLGRLAFAMGDYPGWRREFEHARRIDPERFARLRHPLELFEPRLAGTAFDDAGERATWRAMRPFASGGAVRASTALGEAPPDLGRADARFGDSVAAERADDAARLPSTEEPIAFGDDCSSAIERERFASLGPIARGEMDACDLDELARRLIG
jgi:hypothetical protein